MNLIVFNLYLKTSLSVTMTLSCHSTRLFFLNVCCSNVGMAAVQFSLSIP